MVRLFILPFMVFLLASCSGKKSAVQIEITRSFVNSSFKGGLIVHGRNAVTGKEFSLSLPDQTSTSVALDFGVWEIRAVGWENNTAEPFQGIPFCAAETVDFKADGQRAALQVTNDKCNDQRFAGTSYLGSGMVAGAGVNFSLIPFYVCGALFDPNSPSQLISPSNLNFDHNLCDTYPRVEMPVQSMKVSFSNVAPDGSISEGLSSTCIGRSNTAGGNPSFPHTLSLPTKLPLTITFYETAACADSSVLKKYIFPQGLEHSLPRSAMKFDSVLGVITKIAPSSPALFLASTLSDRGTTPYGTEMPKFTCGSGPCFHYPLTDTSDFYVSNGDNVVRIAGSSHICGEVSLASTSNTISMYACQQDVSGLILKLNVQVSSTPAVVSVTLSSTTAAHPDETYSFRVDHGHRIFKDLKDLFVAAPPTSGDISDSMLDQNMKDESNAIAAQISDILSPSKLGGIFWDQACSTSPLTAPIKRATTFFEDGTPQSLEVVLMNPPSTVAPGFIANRDNPQSSTQVGVYHRRFIVRRLIDFVTGFKTFLVMDLACDGIEAITPLTASSVLQTGRMEEMKVESDATQQRTEKTLTFWNTANVINSRFERYRLEFSTSSGQDRRQTSFVRAEKFPNAGNSNADYKVTMLDYHYDNSSGERFQHRDVNVSGDGINVIEDSFHQNTSDPGVIFTDDKNLVAKTTIRYGSGLEQIRNHPSGKFLSMKVMPNSNGDPVGTIQTNFNGSFQTIQDTMVSPTGVASDISPDGTKGIVAFFGTSVKIYTFDGTQVLTSLATFDPDTIGDYRALIHNNGDLLILMKSMTVLYFNTGHASSGSLPTTVPAQNILTGLNFFDVSAVSRGVNDFWLFTTRRDESASPPVQNINYCRIWKNASGIWSGCTLDNLNSTSSTNGTYEISAGLKESTGEVVVSFIETDLSDPDPMTNRIAEHTYKVLSGQSTITWNHTQTMNFSNSHFTSYGYSMTSMATAPSPFDISIPYATPAIPAFQMNYMSLRPEFMNQNVFTPMSAFENLGGNL